MWKQQIITTERGDFELFTKGSGQPLCVTHLYSEFNKNGNLFANIFTKNATVYLVNLRGCGNSSPQSEDYTLGLDDAVKDLEAIRKSLSIEKWIFAGHSTGGMLALKYATQFPESLVKIIAGGLCASSDYMKDKGSIYCSQNPNNTRLLEILSILKDTTSTLEQRRAVGKEWTLMSLYNEDTYDEMVRRPNSGKTVPARLDYFSYEELPTYDIRGSLADVYVEAHIYSGRHDAQCPHHFSKEAAELMANATMTTFEYSNHFPFIEEEKEFERFVQDDVSSTNTLQRTVSSKNSLNH